MRTQLTRALGLGLLAAFAGLASAHHAAEYKIIPADLSTGDQFGFAVDIDGGYACAGAPRQDDLGADSGSVYVLDLQGADWVEAGKLHASDGAAGALFGYSVAINGDTIVVGAPFASGGGAQSGAVYVFTRSGSSWTEQAALIPSSFSAGDRFGFQVSISGDTLIAGSPNLDTAFAEAGAAFVFVRSGSSWSEEAMLTASDEAASDFFGTSVSLDQDRALIGSIGADGSAVDTGAAYLFERTGTTWSEDLKFTELESTSGDLYGTSVSVKGDQIAIGAPGHDEGGAGTGQAFIYADVAGVWTLQLTEFGSVGGDNFGVSVDIASSGFAVVGVTGDDEEALNAGKAFLYTQQVANPFEILVSADPVAGDRLGISVALSETCWSIIGADGHDDQGSNSGSVDLFTLVPNFVTYCTAGTSVSGCAAAIGGRGVPNSTASEGFVVEVTNLEGGKDGLFFYSPNGRQALAWGSSNSFRCVTTPVRRGGIRPGTGTPGVCDGIASQDLNSRWQTNPNQNPGAGAVVQIQFWYRDPANTSGQSSSMSDALEVSVCP